MSWKEKLDIYNEKREKALTGGGVNKIKIQHEKGKLTARERIELLVDKDTFCEIFSLVESRDENFNIEKQRVPGDGVVVGYGKIDGRIVYISSEDFTVMGGTLGEYHSFKICKVLEKAIDTRSPMIFINDSGGARIEEGIASLNGYSNIFYKQVMASGMIPQIAIILGPCAGGACYGPALCDFIFTVKEITKMFITGPKVVKTIIGENVTENELGAAQVHTNESGVAHFCYNNEIDCMNGVRHILSYVYKNEKNNEKEYKRKLFSRFNYEEEIEVKDKKSLLELVPDNSRKSYDMHEVIYQICDLDSFFEIQRHFATNSIIGFARINKENIGIIANQPMVVAGTLDCDTSDKMARFIRFCDCFSIPIVTLVDVPGYYPGSKQEHAGIIRHGAKLIYAFAEAMVPKISIILRKAYGGAYIAMNSMGIGADFVYAWPSAEIAVMGSQGAINIVFRNKIRDAENPEAKRKELEKEYDEHFINPYIAAKRGYITDVIQPDETRDRIKEALEYLKNKKTNRSEKYHGNIPL